MEMPDNMGEDYVKRFKAMFPGVAKRNKIPLIPFLLKGVGGRPDMNQPDMMHPNEKGQEVLAATVWAALAPLLKNSPGHGRDGAEGVR